MPDRAFSISTFGTSNDRFMTLAFLKASFAFAFLFASLIVIAKEGYEESSSNHFKYRVGKLKTEAIQDANYL